MLNNNADEDFIKRMAAKTNEVRKSKEGLGNAAKEYTEKYQKEVDEGTKRRQLLIENGIRQGKTEEEVIASLAVFIPTKQTPILNLLHFLLYEYDGAADQVQFLREDKDRNINHNKLVKDLNEKYGSLQEADIDQNIPEILEYVYENVTTDIFKKVKKLKALATNNPKTPEQYAAMGKAFELCKKFNLEYEKIRCEID